MNLRLAAPLAAAFLITACASTPPPEVRGTPAPGSPFQKLRMGMGMKEVTRLIGPPTSEHAYITGKGFLFSPGADTYRQEYRYKGVGRLTFASNGGLSLESQLIRIVHDPDEKGTKG